MNNESFYGINYKKHFSSVKRIDAQIDKGLIAARKSNTQRILEDMKKAYPDKAIVLGAQSFMGGYMHCPLCSTYLQWLGKARADKHLRKCEDKLNNQE